jgi:AAA family ATP:ADP antiporter
MANPTSITAEQPSFGKLRSFFWPIYSYELKKLVPMLLLFFFILFNYTVLRDTKDTLIVTAPNSGAEAIPFLKVYGVLPFALIFMMIYSKMSNALSKPALFYCTVLPFILFFGVFAVLLYPNREVLQPKAFCDFLQGHLPHGLMGLVAIVRHWTFSLFYIMSELWGSVCLSLLFWGFANDITKVGESKRFYNLFGLGANFSLLLAGTFIVWASDLRRSLSPAITDPWQVSLNWLMLIVVLSGFLILGIYWWINKYVLTDARFYNTADQKKMKKEKPKMTFKESLKYIVSSKYMGCLALIVIAYGVSINLVEVTWKSQLKLQYPNPNDYSVFMGNFSRVTGAATIFMMFFVTGNVVRKLGWKFAALLTPVVLFITGAAFFFFMIFNHGLAGFISALGTTPLFLAVVFGMAQNVMSKSAKYSLFDPTKEMAYIPLDQEQKVKGKAAIDVVGARLGKSGGALIQQVLILLLGSIAAMAPYIGVLLFVIIGGWILAVISLDKQFKVAIAKKEDEEAKLRQEETIAHAQMTISKQKASEALSPKAT